MGFRSPSLGLAVWAVAQGVGCNAPPSDGPAGAVTTAAESVPAKPAQRFIDVAAVGAARPVSHPGDCAPPVTITAGDHRGIEIDFSGFRRTYDLHVPPGHDGSRPLPLIVAMHGLAQSGAELASSSGLDAAADEAGYVVVYPKGTVTSWNAGRCCGTAVEARIDDVGFARAVVEHVAGRVCIDERRVYATGLSNGGAMAYRLACEASDLFAAVAPVAASMGIEASDCRPSRPVPILHFHGDFDLHVPIRGSVHWPAVDAVVAQWAEHNHCRGPRRATVEGQTVACWAYADCDDGGHVGWCRVLGGGHCWPDDQDCPLGRPTTEIPVAKAMIHFFSAHPRG